MLHSNHRTPLSLVEVKNANDGDASDGSQNPRIWQGKDQAGKPGQHRASYEITARTVKFLGHQRWPGSREGNRGAPMTEPPPGSEDEEVLPF